MMIDEIVQNIREEQRKRFGDVGTKKDCTRYMEISGVPQCRTCKLDFTKYGEYGTLQCELDVCYFYDPKE